MSASSQPFDRYSPDRVRLWLQERLENAQRLAKQKTGDDRLGWLDDANYYEAAIKLLPAPEDKYRIPGETMKLAWAFVQCWWYCLLHFKCMATEHRGPNGGPQKLVKLYACDPGFIVVKVFWERK